MLRNPIALALPPGWSLQDAGVAIGWITAASVYLALGYLPFFYRWRRTDAARGIVAAA